MHVRQRRFFATPAADPWPQADLALDFIGIGDGLRGRPFYKKAGKIGFHPKEVEPSWTFASGQGLMYQGADNLWKVKAANDDTILPTDGGIWPFVARQNLVSHSQDQGGVWSSTNIVRVVGRPSPDGGNNARDYTNTVNVNSFVNHVTTPSPLAFSTTYTRSLIAKSMGGNGVVVLESHLGVGQAASYFHLNTGVAGSNSGGATSTITALGDGWYLCTQTFTTSATGSPQGRVVYVGAYGSLPTETTIRIWQADVQPGAYYAGSIYTNGGAVTRGVTVARLNWSPGASGFILARGRRADVSTNNTPRLIGSNGAGNAGPLVFQQGGVTTWNGTNGVSASIPAGQLAVGSKIAAVVTWGPTRRQLCVNGALSNADANAIGTWTQLHLGADGSFGSTSSPNLPLELVVAGTAELSAADMQAITRQLMAA